jgi:hypothetical protein
LVSNLDKYKAELKILIDLGWKLLIDLSKEISGEKVKKDEVKYGRLFCGTYQEWYSRSYAVISQLLPDRLEEFISLYRKDEKRKVVNVNTYKIQDWLLGSRSVSDEFRGGKRFNDEAIVTMSFQQQIEILRAAEGRFTSSLYDIKELLQADLFDSELDCARELSKKGFHRAAGAIVGVILEKHLSEICHKHKIEFSRKRMTISDFNDLLKKANVIEIDVWRFIQRLADLRNLCDHDKKREPQESEIDELISGVDKIMKTVF